MSRTLNRERAKSRPRPTRLAALAVAATALPLALAIPGPALGRRRGGAAGATDSAARTSGAPRTHGAHHRPVPRDPHAAAMFAARARAMSTGKRVTVTATTTATSVTVANPNGSFTDTIDALPVRAHAARILGSAERPLGPGQRRACTGRVDGAGAVVWRRVRTGRDAAHNAAGQRLSLWLPARLPAPVVRGATAIYRSVRPGIDVQLTADTFGGVAMKLIVRSRAAAASSWLRQFTVRYSASGVRLTSSAAGDLVAARAPRPGVQPGAADDHRPGQADDGRWRVEPASLDCRPRRAGQRSRAITSCR